jgi:hypothetical protein
MAATITMAASYTTPRDTTVAAALVRLAAKLFDPRCSSYPLAPCSVLVGERTMRVSIRKCLLCAHSRHKSIAAVCSKADTESSHENRMVPPSFRRIGSGQEPPDCSKAGNSLPSPKRGAGVSAIGDPFGTFLNVDRE